MKTKPITFSSVTGPRISLNNLLLLSTLGTESRSFFESMVYFISVTAHTASQAPSMKLTMTTARSHTPVMMVSTDVSSRKLGLLEELCMQESSVHFASNQIRASTDIWHFSGG